MLLGKASAANALTALAFMLSPVRAEPVRPPVLPNIASASDLKEWMAGHFQRQGSSSDVRDVEGTPARRTGSRADLKKLIGGLKTGKIFRKKDGSAADLHGQREEPAGTPRRAHGSDVEGDWRHSLLNEYEGKQGHGADAEKMRNRKYGSLPLSETTGPLNIAKLEKERKAAREKNVYTKETDPTGLGKGMGFAPYMEKPQSQQQWAEHQKYSEAFARQRYEEKQEQLKQEGKPPMESPFKAPVSRAPKHLEYQSSDPEKEAAWQRHHTKAGGAISADRGDAAFNHRYHNTDVTNEPRMARQSFSSREDSSQTMRHQKFDMHNTQSLPSDGRYGGEGSLLGKSPLAMGAEGPRSKSLLAQDDPNYRPGMYSGPLRGTASEQDDIQSTMHKPQSRLEKWQQQRQSVAKSQAE